MSRPTRAWMSILVVTTTSSTAAWGATTLRVGDAGVNLADTVAQAQSGDRVEVPPGHWRGPIVIDRPITIIGTGGVIDGGGKGSIITVRSPDVSLINLRLQNSGEELSGLKPDACVHLSKTAQNSVVKDCRLIHCAFGVWVHETRGVVLEKNRIEGTLLGHRSNRGNGIQLFDALDVTVRGNHITGGRDGIYVSATENSLISDNVLSQTRYGIHYMFSYANTIHKNRSISNGSGYAIMSSLHLTVSDNLAEQNQDHGLLFRDVQYSQIRNNVLRGNGEGLFFYSSTENVIEGNQVLNNKVGAKVWAGSKRNQVRRNRFVGNRRQVFYVSTEDLIWAESGEGNRWGDYLGWDNNQDGIGDRAYRVDSFQSNLIYRYPAAVLLLRSPALELLTHLEQRLPLMRVPTLIDAHPLVGTQTRAQPTTIGGAL
jgi:nitrous oxidase accessory protein